MDFNDNFYNWFKNSKCIDSNGNPLVVYNGGAKFDIFNKDKTAQGIFWFAEDKKESQQYLDNYINRGKKGEIKEVYLSIQNPAGWDEYDKYSIDQLIAQGFDGIYLPDEDGNSWVAFYPNQIKSVNNKGAWSKSNNIYENLNEEAYTYINDNGKDIEILILEDGDSSNKLREFQKGHIALRCFVIGNKMYFWDCDVLHETVAFKLNLNDEVENRFLIDKNDIDGYYIKTFEDMAYEWDIEDVIEMACSYRRNLHKLEKLGLHLSKESEELLDKVCRGDIEIPDDLNENLFKTLNKQLQRIIETFN